MKMDDDVCNWTVQRNLSWKVCENAGHLCSNDRLFWLKIVHFKERPLFPNGTVHFGAGFVRSELNLILIELMRIIRYQTQLIQWQMLQLSLMVFVAEHELHKVLLLPKKIKLILCFHWSIDFRPKIDNFFKILEISENGPKPVEKNSGKTKCDFMSTQMSVNSDY